MNYDRDCLVEIAGLMFVLIGYAFDMVGLMVDDDLFVCLCLFVYVYFCLIGFDGWWWFMRFFLFEYNCMVWDGVLYVVVGDDDIDDSMMSIFYAVFLFGISR